MAKKRIPDDGEPAGSKPPAPAPRKLLADLRSLIYYATRAGVAQAVNQD